MYYKNTITEICSTVYKNHEGLKPKECTLVAGEPAPAEHILWMCHNFTTRDQSSMSDAAKAARDIGWLLQWMEIKGYWSNIKSRNLVRNDKKLGYDLPHDT